MRPVTDRRTGVFSRLRLLLPVLLIVLPVAAAIPQEEPEENEGFLAAKGRVTYRVYCANCHGSEAEGNGNIAKFLKVTPADLTRLSENNGGEFPADQVHRIIDGREVVAVHGRREMPIWGDVFQNPLVSSAGDEGDEERAQRKIRELVSYLKSIQKQEAVQSP